MQQKKEFVRGSAHVSTHNGIRLVSTGRRKDLLGTVEEGVEYAETFKHLLEPFDTCFVKGNTW